MNAPASVISRHAILRRLWRAEDEIKALKTENAKLRAETPQIAVAFPPRWRLQSREAAVLSALMSSGSVVPLELLARVCPGKSLNNISVYVFRLRDNLCRYGVEIGYSRRTGYSISPAHKAIILREIEAASFPPISPVLSAMVAGRQGASA